MASSSGSPRTVFERSGDAGSSGAGTDLQDNGDVATHGAPVRPDLGTPDFRGPLESVVRHPVLFAVPVLALIAVAAAIGLTRAPVYTAETRINVGRVDVPAYTLQGVGIGNAGLASSYARAIDAPQVVEPAADKLDISAASARSRISASPIPESTLIRVEATGDSDSQAQALADAAARSLIAYVGELNEGQGTSALLSRYRAAVVRAERARVRLRRAIREHGRNSFRTRRAWVDYSSDRLHARSLSERYLSGEISPLRKNLLQLMVPATRATSDFASMLGRLLLIGLAVGVVLGVALALARGNRELLRRRAG